MPASTRYYHTVASTGYYSAMRLDVSRLLRALPASSATAALLCCLATPAPSQRPTPPRADYKDLAELLQNLPDVALPALDEERALALGALPLSCLDRLQPAPDDRRGISGRGAAPAANTGAGYFWTATYRLIPDHDRLRAFWGCSDWHSAVASTWVAVHVLAAYPDNRLHELTREKLAAHLGKSNLDGEVAFFHDVAAAINPIPSASQRGLFERPYGFAWLLLLDAELRAWPDSQGQRYAANVAPLAAWMADSLAAYFTTLVEPVRAGTQTNTALSMSLALDYSDVAHDTEFRGAVVTAARRLFLADTACAVQSEGDRATNAGRGGRAGQTGGRGQGERTDSAARSTAPNDLTAAGRGRGATPAAPGGGAVVVSPCLSEAALMSQVLDSTEYLAWLDRFLPPLESGRFAPLTVPLGDPTATPPRVTGAAGLAAADTSPAAAAAALASDRARRAGLSMSRAQSMERIAHALPPTDARVAAWHRLAHVQAARGYELMRDDRAGISWLPAQALLYEIIRKQQ